MQNISKGYIAFYFWFCTVGFNSQRVLSVVIKKQWWNQTCNNNNNGGNDNSHFPYTETFGIEWTISFNIRWNLNENQNGNIAPSLSKPWIFP